jgi:hypothetical protein
MTAPTRHDNAETSLSRHLLFLARQPTLLNQIRHEQSGEIAPCTKRQLDGASKSLQTPQLWPSMLAFLYPTEAWETLIIALAPVAPIIDAAAAAMPPASMVRREVLAKTAFFKFL